MNEIKLSNEEIARVFAMYWGNEIVIESEQFKFPLPMQSIDIDMRQIKVRDEGIKLTFYVSIKDARLLLTPLSKISDEDVSIVASIAWEGKYKSFDEANKYRFKRGVIPSIENYGAIDELFICDNGNIFFNTWRPINIFNCYQYLISKSYAVPLFFAPNHPANGKTAIELGIAIERNS